VDQAQRQILLFEKPCFDEHYRVRWNENDAAIIREANFPRPKVIAAKPLLIIEPCAHLAAPYLLADPDVPPLDGGLRRCPNQSSMAIVALNAPTSVVTHVQRCLPSTERAALQHRLVVQFVIALAWNWVGHEKLSSVYSNYKLARAANASSARSIPYRRWRGVRGSDG
jgi:hypothetical protein